MHWWEVVLSACALVWLSSHSSCHRHAGCLLSIGLEPVMPRTEPDCRNRRYAMLTTGHTRGAVSEEPWADSPQASPGKAGTLVAGGTTPHALEAQAWEGLCTTARPGSCQTPAQGQAGDPSRLLWLDWTPWATPHVAQLPGAGTGWVSTGAPPCCMSGLAGSAVRRCMGHSCKLQAVTWSAAGRPSCWSSSSRCCDVSRSGVAGRSRLHSPGHHQPT